MKRLLLALILLPTVAMSAQVGPEIKLPVQQVSAVSVSPASVIGGATAIGTVILYQAAGSNGVAVKFVSSNPAIAAVPVGTVVQPGSTTATFVIQTYPVAVNPNVITDAPYSQISALVGNVTRSAKLTVLPPSFTSLTLDPTSVAGSNPATGVVSLSGPAPAGGFTIGLQIKNLESAQLPNRQMITSNAPIATVPSQVVIPAGATSASFPITTRAVSLSMSLQINATYSAFVTKSVTLTVLPPAVASIDFGLSTYQCLVSGQSATGTIRLTAPAPAEGMMVPLSLLAVSATPGIYCPSSTACGPAPVIPSSVQLTAGSTSASFPVTVSPGNGCYQVSAGGQTKFLRVSQPLIHPNKPLDLPQSAKGGTAIQAKLQLDGVVSNCGLAGHHKVQSSNTVLAQVPAEVIVPVGSSAGSFMITTSAVASTQTVEIGVTGCYGSCCANYGPRKVTLTITP